MSERALIFAAGFLVGAGVVCFAKSRAGHKVAVAVAKKGLELQECVAKASERTKEAFEDIVAEARYSREQKADA